MVASQKGITMKDSFVLYTKYSKHIQKLSMEQRGILFTAILSYMEEEELPEMEAATDMIFGIIKEDIDECNRKWEETKQKRVMAGSVGGKAKARNAKQKVANVANATNAKQDVANVADNVNVNVYVNKEKEKKKKVAPVDTEFEELWSIYPKKQGKSQAKKSYEKDRKSGATFDDVKKGVEAYKAYIEATGTEPQYVKMGSTFFNQRSWADEWIIPKVRAKPNSNVPEPPKYPVFEPEPEVDSVPMPKETEDVLNRLKGMF